jgi:hypothetical protein
MNEMVVPVSYGGCDGGWTDEHWHYESPFPAKRKRTKTSSSSIIIIVLQRCFIYIFLTIHSFNNEEQPTSIESSSYE